MKHFIVGIVVGVALAGGLLSADTDDIEKIWKNGFVAGCLTTASFIPGPSLDPEKLLTLYKGIAKGIIPAGTVLRASDFYEENGK